MRSIKIKSNMTLENFEKSQFDGKKTSKRLYRRKNESGDRTNQRQES